MTQNKSYQGPGSRSASQGEAKGGSQKHGAGTSRKSSLKEDEIGSGGIHSNK